MVLDDGERFEGLPKADAVGDDAPPETVQLVDRADDAVALKLEQLLPHDGVADARGRVDHALLIELVAPTPEEMMKNQRVDAEGGPMRGKRLKRLDQTWTRAGVGRQCVPLDVKPLTEHARLARGLGCLNQAERIAWRDAEPVGAERERAENYLLRLRGLVPQHDGPLRHGASSPPHLGPSIDPVREVFLQSAAKQAVPCCAVGGGAKKCQISTLGRQNKSRFRNLGKLLEHLLKCEEGQLRGDQIDLSSLLEFRSDEIDNPLGSHVADDLHAGGLGWSSRLTVRASSAYRQRAFASWVPLRKVCSGLSG